MLDQIHTFSLTRVGVPAIVTPDFCELHMNLVITSLKFYRSTSQKKYTLQQENTYGKNVVNDKD